MITRRSPVDRDGTETRHTSGVAYVGQTACHRYRRLDRSLSVGAASASEVLRAVFKVISESVSAGQIKEVRGQLLEEMKALFPIAA